MRNPTLRTASPAIDSSGQPRDCRAIAGRWRLL